MRNIFNYKLYLFDLDGTVIDSEPIHYKSYKKAYQDCNLEELTFDKYIKLSHSISSNYKTELGELYPKLYRLKESYFKEFSKEIKLIAGFEEFAQQLFRLGKDVCIVTHSNKKRIEIIKQQFPFLKKIFYWIGYEDQYFKKPSPESYVKAINMYPYQLSDCIAFEDSLKGMMTINQIDIDKVMIQSLSPYPLSINFPISNVFPDFQKLMETGNIITSSISISNHTQEYISQIQKYEAQINKTVNLLVSILNNTKSNIYLTGIGKLGIICEKVCSTWRCLGLNVHYINLLQLYHGEFGVFQDDDIIIYVDKSGKTPELLRVAQHFKDNFNVMQILISCQKIKNIFNLSLTIGTIKEIDPTGLISTTSSIIFMMLLDMVGIELGKSNVKTTNNLAKYHPGSFISQSKPIDCVVIYASGKGTRLYPLTWYIPKLLVNISNDNMLKHITRYWSHYTSNIILVIESKYNTQVEFYKKLIEKEMININVHIRFSITNVDLDKNVGNSYTIKQSIIKGLDQKQELTKYLGKKVLFTWCDICPKSYPNKHIFTESNIIFTHGNECRYNAKDNHLEKLDSGGNVIGIYYFGNFQGLKTNELNQLYEFKYEDTMDLCDVFQLNYPQFKTYEIEELTDIGDMKKLEKFQQLNHSKYVTRYFNQITEIPDPGDPGKTALLKSSNCNLGDEIILKEMKWYRIVNKSFTPKILSFNFNSFVMSKINGEPLYKTFWDKTYKQQKIILKRVLAMFQELHKDTITKQPEDINKDIENELFYKKLNRINKVLKLISSFPKFKSINNIPITVPCDHYHIINDLYFNVLLPYFKNRRKYELIHGDCQFSNILLDNNNKLYLIDPKGHFGSSSGYGIMEYDYAKLLYALSGYDHFNNNLKYYIDIDEKTPKNINLHIYNDMDRFMDLFLNLDIKLEKDVLIAMVIINWFGLVQFCQNNIIKCIASYYYAVYLFQIYFRNK